jgi:hypothetical protein
MLPVAPLIGLGISLIPKIPAMWDAIAKLFGAKVPETVVQAGQLAETVLGAVTGGQVKPEQMAELQKIIMSHEEEMAKIALEERKVDVQETQIKYDLMKGAQNVEIESYKSDDSYVRQTRPLILRKLFYLLGGYVVFAPILIVLMYYLKMGDGAVAAVSDMLGQSFMYLSGIFAVAFTGYTIVRGQEKKAITSAGTPCAPEANGNGGSILAGFNPFATRKK